MEASLLRRNTPCFAPQHTLELDRDRKLPLSSKIGRPRGMRICANHFYFARIGSLVLGKSHFAARGRRFQVNIPTAFISTFRPQNGPSAFGCVQNELRFANWSSCVASKRKTNSRSSKTCKRYPVRGGRRGRGRVGCADSTPACKFRKASDHR